MQLSFGKAGEIDIILLEQWEKYVKMQSEKWESAPYYRSTTGRKNLYHPCVRAAEFPIIYRTEFFGKTQQLLSFNRLFQNKKARIRELFVHTL